MGFEPLEIATGNEMVALLTASLQGFWPPEIVKGNRWWLDRQPVSWVSETGEGDGEFRRSLDWRSK
ncbi:hypothetical protein CASFOL_035519 [Castilleja foliolosa]|uniref:Uncharacterized protein n=1 Tax=Castilleja foliolosa TaxID=1961234 RepID=A0ABD3BTJ2_9LAMI